MRVGPYELTVRRTGALNARAQQLQAVDGDRGWWPLTVHEPFAGAWQRNIEWTTDSVLAHPAVYACVSLISSDMGKLEARLMERDSDGIWSEVDSPSFSPVLRKPNRIQNHIQFKEWWTTSKLLRGNTYALKERDGRGIVIRLHLLDADRVRVLVAPNGSVYYELKRDNLGNVEQESVTIPASEIIHDRINCLFHPLVGTSPIFACGLTASMGQTIEKGQSAFFGNGAKVSGQLLIPTSITQTKADELRQRWQDQFTGEGAGQIAVLSGGMKFEPLQMTNEDAQLIEQLNWSARQVCTAFRVPPWKIHVGQQPAYTKPEIADQQYYSDCLQSHIEQYELCMDEGLGIGRGVKTDEGKMYGVELDLDKLLRMDAGTQVETLTKAVRGGLYTPNEARWKADKKPLKGGDTVYLQEQDHAMEALFERDQNDPFAKPEPVAPAPQPKQLPPPEEPQDKKAFDFNAAGLHLIRAFRTAA